MYWVTDMTVWMAEEAHQVVELTVVHTLNSSLPSQSLVSPAGVVWAENTPVHLSYGWYQDDSADFFGYVASSRVLGSETDPRYGHAVAMPVVYTLVGASMTMQSRRNKLWSDVSPSYIAKTVGASYNFQPQVDFSAVRFDSRMQTYSDWVFLSELTDRIGYRLFLDGTTLWFVDRHTVMPTVDNTVPVFTQSKVPGVVNSLRQFSATVGDTDPAGGVRATFQTASVGAESGVLSYSNYTQPRTDVRGNPVAALVTAQYTGRPAQSYAEAAAILSSDTTYLWVEARALVNGDARLRPGCLVDLQGDALGAQNVGLWMVRSATHRFTVSHLDARKTEYTCDLVVGRDDAQQLQVPPVTAATPKPPTVLVSGLWRAQYLQGV